MLEKEYKSIITEEKYNAVKNYFDWDWIKEQTNNYYTDDNGLFFKNKIMFRVREKDGKAVIQVKTKKSTDTSLQICEENEFPADDICSTGVPDIIDSPERYTGIKTESIRRMGAAKTLRCSKMWDKHTEICLDRTIYFDKCDYEIEIEYTSDDIPAELKQILNGLGITFDKKAVGKFSRFLNEYNKKA